MDKHRWNRRTNKKKCGIELPSGSVTKKIKIAKTYYVWFALRVGKDPR